MEKMGVRDAGRLYAGIGDPGTKYCKEGGRKQPEGKRTGREKYL